MRKNHFSPLASTMMAFALALGILVADLTNVHTLRGADAQTAYASVAEATVLGVLIPAESVLVNGVPVSGAFLGSVVVVDSFVASGDSTSAGGVNVGDGVAPPSESEGGDESESGDETGVSGVNVGDGLMSNGVNVGDGSPSIIGGTVEGTGVKVVDGVITGENLRVVGAYVDGGLWSVVVTATGTTSTPMQ